MKFFNKMKFKAILAFRILITNIMILVILGCSTSRQLSIHISGDEKLNGGGYAVEVCIFQLKSDTNFLLSTVESFWRDYKDYASDLVELPIKIMLKPQERKLYKFSISNETKFIGAAANFYSPDKKGWRQAYPISSKHRGEILVLVGYDNIVIRKR